MHAASVNPEPGSNSLKNCILALASRRVNTFFRAIFTSLSYLITCLYFVNSKCFNEIFRTFQCLKNFNVVQFSMIKPRSLSQTPAQPPLERRSIIIQHMSRFVNSKIDYFFIFFAFFSFLSNNHIQRMAKMAQKVKMAQHSAHVPLAHTYTRY